jgi:Na+/proline symporter
MYFPCVILFWNILGLISDEELTNGLGSLVGLFIVGLFTVFYVIFFGVHDYNWIDILKGTQHIFTNFNFTW